MYKQKDTSSILRIGSHFSPGQVPVFILDASHGCATIVISLSHVILDLDLGCRSSLCTRSVCALVRGVGRGVSHCMSSDKIMQLVLKG